jgi:CBS domain containing-hemolysin-like protein
LIVKVRISTFVRAVALVLAFAVAEPCLASSGAFVDKAANFLAIFIIIALPIGGVILFWLVHILPEKAAEKRHHPQKDAIQVLCLLSLVFGGLLWPLAWLWAYSKPVLHKLAYGRDKHDDYYAELEQRANVTPESAALNAELAALRQDLETLEERGELTDAMRAVRERLARLESRTTPGGAAEGVR